MQKVICDPQCTVQPLPMHRTALHLLSSRDANWERPKGTPPAQGGSSPWLPALSAEVPGLLDSTLGGGMGMH